MLKRLAKGMALAIGLCVLLGTLAYTADQTILGKSFLIKDPQPNVSPTLRKIVVLGKEPAPDDLVLGDPTLPGSVGGAILEVIATGSGPNGGSQVFTMPASGWIRVPSNPASALVGYKYIDPNPGALGPVKTALIKRPPNNAPFILKVVILGANGPGAQPHITQLPPAPGDQGGVIFTIGGTERYCMTFGGPSGGKVVNSPNPTGEKVFKIASTALQPTSEATGCPTPPSTTTSTAAPTTTITTTTATTTTSTTTSTTTTTTTTTSTTTTTTAPSCVPQPSGLVSWYRMEGSANDHFGTNNPSATSAISFVAGEVGQGVTLGGGGFIDIPDSPSLELQQITLDAWARPDGPGPTPNGSVIITKNTNANDLSIQLGWTEASGGRFSFSFFQSGANTSVLSADPFPPGAFHHVAGTYDGATFRLYVDGVLEGSFAFVTTIAYNSSIPWVIGANNPPARGVGFPRTWNGVIDEVEIISGALSPSEVAALYAAGSTGKCL